MTSSPRKDQAQPEDNSLYGREWTAEELAVVSAHAKKLYAQQTPEERLENELLSIRYAMEFFIDEHLAEPKQQPLQIDSILKRYLKALNLSFKKFAQSIDTTDGNLKKYLSGERKFNTDLALKFGAFFHVEPELWLKVQMKNELLILSKQKKLLSRYKKYDYKKVYQIPEPVTKPTKPAKKTKKIPATK